MITPPSHSRLAPWWFVIPVILFLAWESRALQSAWTLDLSNRNGLIAFLIWFIGSIVLAILTPYNLRSATWWTIALLFCLAGKLGDMEVLKHIGIAVGIAGILPNSVARAACLVGALSWTTALSWFTQHYFYLNSDPYRIPLAVLTLGIMIFFCKIKASSVFLLP